MLRLECFRGLFYNVEKVEAIQSVVAPPYDVIDERLRQRLLHCHPYNVVRLILPSVDPKSKDRYEAAARLQADWLERGIIIEDEEPTLYIYSFRYADPTEQPATQRALVCALELQDYADNLVRPHESTIAQPKEDRLKLLRATQSQFDIVQGLFSDPEKSTAPLFAESMSSQPICQVKMEGVEHLLWRLSCRHLIEEWQRLLRSRWVIIADGHHRYETALTYREQLQRQMGQLPPNHPANFVTIALVNIDEKVTVLPTHRIVPIPPDVNVDGLEKQLTAGLHAESLPLHNLDKENVRRQQARSLEAALCQHLQPHSRIHAFAAVFNHRAYLLAIPHEEVEDHPNLRQLPPEVAEVDTTVLHRWLLPTLLSSENLPFLENQLSYTHDTSDALKATLQPSCMAILLRPTPPEQIQKVTAAGHRMPAKSTYFYPKLLSGFVMRRVLEK